MKDIGGFVTALADMEMVTDESLVRQRSRDMTAAYSPVMKRELRDKSADLIVRPQDRAQVIRVAAAAARYRVPLIARGAGTANFGQAIPLQGGAIVDMTALNRILGDAGPILRAEPGVRMIDIDNATRPAGWELRIHPSTKRTATLGGFVAGGHAGIGSCVYGILRDRGNIIGMEVVSVEDTPRIVELRGSDVNLVHHAYGSNGLITAIELPLAPAWAWLEVVVVFTDFMTATRFARELAQSDGIIKKLISIAECPLGAMMRPLAPFVKPDETMVLCMIAKPFEESFRTLVAEFDGEISSLCAEDAGAYEAPLYEFTWGHARLRVNRTDRSLIGCMGLFPVENDVKTLERSHHRFRNTGPMQLEVKRFDGTLSMQGSPLFSYVDDAHLASVMEGMADDGAVVADNHTYRVKEGGIKSVKQADVAFKQAMDPYNLLNPGKMDIAEALKPQATISLPVPG